MSGNEFVKLIERDILPKWASPELLVECSTASCTITGRKITWVKNNQLQVLHR